MPSTNARISRFRTAGILLGLIAIHAIARAQGSPGVSLEGATPFGLSSASHPNLLSLSVLDVPSWSTNEFDTNALAKPETAPRGKVARFLTPAEQYDPQRFWISVGTATALYAGFSVGLWEAWYKDFEIGRLKSIDDRKEWEQMDKVGHIYTAYHYARWSFQGLRWSGTRRPKALVMAVGTSLVLQSTIEVMDGYSEAWGFSWADMASNFAGAGLFATQELLWHEQRVNFKVSSFRRDYSEVPIPSRPEGGPSSSLRERAEHLYGATPWQRFIKDYNGQTLWLTANPTVLFGADEPKLPWLNLAVGRSGRDIFGAFSAGWSENGFSYNGNPLAERGVDYVLSLDIDFDRIPTRSPVLKTVFHLLNHVKVPAPALVLAKANRPDYRWLYY